MFSIIIGIVIAFAAIMLAITLPAALPRKAIALALFLFGSVVGLSGSVSYNDAGYCAHIRTLFGMETSKCDIGWYFSGWGNTTLWPHYFTIGNVANPQDVKQDSISTRLDVPYRVKLADNWAGDITQSTRFGIPQNEEKFLKLARDLRTPENLIASTLVPSVKASLDTTANLFTMEEYYSGGQRDAFKNEYRDTITYGPAATEKITDESEIQKRVAPAEGEAVQDKAETSSVVNITILTKKADKNGKDIRPNLPDYAKYGIVVSTAIIENLDADEAYEKQVVKRKEALGRRVIARDQRLEQEEQRLLKIAEAERDIAEEQGKARKAQIKATTDAETTKKLTLIKAQQQTEEAAIVKKTAEISFQTAEINAKAQIVKAEADAKERQLAIEADNALQTKINAEIEIQKVWADAFARRNVPQIVFGGSADGAPVGSNSEVQTFFNLLNANAAKSLSYDRTVAPDEVK
ncbi:membrane protease subunit stomatin/prohibitin [Sinorhizobium phage phiN3]|uniref:Membrane protease subunit stomatin/prohibitin n=1 Tax=Sinorhizobium phage phiN3 TaxID=1647405 RepID=A0A0F6WCV7_9CAUD|nr:membrane protease subunit stomatin/prohibitin [Sinorhizobium phage phiN3]AKF13652.1 membrane protease subunit stomatin/prohibitin [Sinorhizobium phage phiN3]